MIAFLKINILTLAAACILDWIIGDPRWLPHPVRLMGRMIGWLEGDLRARFQGREKLAGTLLTAAMVLFWTAVPGLLFFILWKLCLGDGRALILLQGIFCSQLLAARDLQKESCLVGSFLKKGDLSGARASVSMIVGRDTKRLGEAGIARAAVETVAENTGDGVIAPMVFIALFGPAGGYFYKAVNTMDSMIGYNNEKYRMFGRRAAKLDDLVNLIPARLTGLLFCLAAWIMPGYDGAGAWNIFLRDRRKHPSPNSAHGEAACAGALGLRLAGDSWYGGVLHHKPWIGEERRPVSWADIGRACGLMYAAQGIFLAVCLGILLLVQSV